MTTRTLLAAAVLAAGAALAAAPTATAAPSDTPFGWGAYQEYSPLCTLRGIGCVNWSFAPMKAAEGITNGFLPAQS
ncbi:hypothetical protein [Streptomyces sp. NPDC054787]